MDINELYASKNGVCIMWMGNDGWVINLHGVVIFTDMDLHSPEHLPLPPHVSIREMAGHIQAVFVTHEHGDHFNAESCLYMQKHSGCVFVIPKSCYSKAIKTGLRDERIVVASPGVDFTLLGMNVHPVRAIHGHYHGSVYSGANMGDCGYVINSKGFTLYQPGDTLLLEEHFEMGKIDLLFFSPTEHNTHIDNSVRMIKLIRPGLAVPQHYDSYVTTAENAFWTKGYPDEVYEKLSDSEKSKYIKLPQGRPHSVV